MSNVIRHPKFHLGDGDDTLARLKAVRDSLGGIDERLRLAAPLFSPADRFALRANCHTAQAEIGEMISEGSFTRDRLIGLALRLRENRRILQRSGLLGK